ncbi:catecholate siderophore receptor CirA [Lacunisphaera limnophila]|uniref:Catecholate siderophore receptor CirA n=1 Tax=Lacunisphaera limnophila TaxID=1838286 RepID=A0A1D8ARL0_9BACT|nr:TonB-dependent copper receptor [Lacunisphaera limnophila]AOS43517.1 catecholate siderophore receptor CirA [Lacunisphaera limnophila]
MKTSARVLLALLAQASTALLAQTTAPAPAAGESDPIRLEPVVITAAQTQQPLVITADPKAPAQPVPAHDGADVLKNIPGFAVIRKGGTDGDPVLRGLAGSRLGIQVDGECIFGGCGSRMDPPTAYVFPTAYDRITVIKGPQTVLHGPGNTAGVVLFERDLRRLDQPYNGFLASATAASFGRVDGVVDARSGTATVQARATGTFTRADDYEDGAGRAVHSAYERWSTNATLAWTPDAHTVVEFTGARSDGEAAYADRMMDGVLFDRTNYAVQVRRENLSSLVTRAEARWFHNYVDHVMDNYTLRPFVASMMMPGRSVSNPDRLTTGGLAQLTLAPAAAVTVTAGLDTQRNVHALRSTMNQGMMPYEARARVRDAKFTQAGAFAEGNWLAAPGHRVIAGARLDRWEAQDPRATVALSMMSTAANPSAGRTRTSDLASGFARYEHDLDGGTPVTLYAGLGRVQRFPDYWELIKNESAATVSAFGTKPETTTQFDAGALYRAGPVEFSLSVFAADLADYILVQSNVAKPSGMMGSRMAVITRNIDASTFGGEAALAWRFAEHWKADASLAYVRGENDTDSRPLAQLPPLEGRLALAYATTDWSAGGLVRLVSAQDRVAVNQGNIVGQDIGRSSGFAILSLNASRRFGQHFRLSAGIDNLLDRTYAEHISRAGGMVSGFIQTTRVNEPGRTLWLKLDASY